MGAPLASDRKKIPSPPPPVLATPFFPFPLLSLGLEFLHGFLNFGTEIEWERRPSPPCALRGVDWIQFRASLWFLVAGFLVSFVLFVRRCSSGVQRLGAGGGGLCSLPCWAARMQHRAQAGLCAWRAARRTAPSGAR